ncbi:Protein of unknown function [Eubacterium ruminantium]|nr:Protein of unknown function [Eubacterium ruminantium]
MSKKNANDKDVTVSKIKLIRTIVISVIVLFILIFFMKKFDEYIKARRQPALSAQKLTEQLVACSDLTAAEIIYNGVVRFDDGGIPLINEKSFLMMYSARVKAGIDISQVNVSVTDNKVIVTLPEVRVLDLIVENNSLEFYDKSSSLFNQVQQEDVVTAVLYAEDDVRNHADIEGLLNKAKVQTESLIRNMIAPVAGDRELIIRYVDEVEKEEKDGKSTTESKK